MLDEKTILKLKEVAKKLGGGWVFDSVNSHKKIIIFNRGRNLRIKLYREYNTKFKYQIGIDLLYKSVRHDSIVFKNMHYIQLNFSAENIAKSIKNAIPENIEKRIENTISKGHKDDAEKQTHRFFIESLRKMCNVTYASKSNNYRDIELEIDNNRVNIYNRGDNRYDFSVTSNREKLIQLIKVLNES